MKTNRLLQPILQDAVDTLSSIHSGRVSCTSVVASCLERIALADPLVHACIDVLSESAQKSAALVDDKIYRGEKLGALEGLPIVVKGNIDVAGSLTTAATAALAEWRPSSTALCVLRLQEQGAIVIAKTNLPEFALRLDAWSPLYGTCLNPHAESYSAGGSSSGTAVAIACGMAPCGLGTDTAGSIRIPAACNGLVGFRPSRGRWSGQGIVPIDSLKDTPGPLGISVRDITLLDAVASGKEVPAASQLCDFSVGVPEDWIEQAEEMDSTCIAALEDALSVLDDGGTTIFRDNKFKDVLQVFPSFSKGVDSSGELQRYLDSHTELHVKSVDEVISGLPQTSTVRRLYTPITDKELLRRDQANRLLGVQKLEQAYRAYFKTHNLHAIIVPSMPIEPIPITGWDDNHNLETQTEPSTTHYHKTAFFTMPLCNIPIPSISLPVPSTSFTIANTLPASVMLLGVDDDELLAVAAALEDAWRKGDGL